MDCPICLNKKSSKFLVELECHHKLCHSCAYSWLIKNPTCPCCRQKSWYFIKHTRSLATARTLVHDSQTMWREIRTIYQHDIPCDVFLEYIRYFFLLDKHKDIWYRPQLVAWKDYYKEICRLYIHSHRLSSKNRAIYDEFMR